MPKDFTHKANICHLEHGITDHYIRKQGKHWLDDQNRLFESEYGFAISDTRHETVLDVNSITSLNNRDIV